MLMAGWGMQRQQFGKQKHWMIVTLWQQCWGKSAHPAAVLVFLHFANGGNPTRRSAVLFHAGQLAGWLRCGG
ncbi:hypothetical protein ACVXG9_12150 [Escherichia coli]